jgi:hypothetical protein
VDEAGVALSQIFWIGGSTCAGKSTVASRLERDDRIGEEIGRRGRDLGLKVIEVDGSRDLDDIAAEAEAHLGA